MREKHTDRYCSIQRIKKIAGYSDRIELHNSDAIELVDNLLGTLPPNTLFYFDPPYYVKGKGLYRRTYATME